MKVLTDKLTDIKLISKTKQKDIYFYIDKLKKSL